MTYLSLANSQMLEIMAADLDLVPLSKEAELEMNAFYAPSTLWILKLTFYR